MTYEEAIKILHPDTTFTTLAEVEYFGGFNGEEAKIKAVEEACVIACEALKKRMPMKPRETRCALMCANCGHKITEKGCKKLGRLYCKKCGQAIDLGESE